MAGVLSTFGIQMVRVLEVSTVGAMASQWVSLNYVRAALTLVGWVAALKAFSLPSA